VNGSVPLLEELLGIGDRHHVVDRIGDNDVFLPVFHCQSHRVELAAADVQDVVGVDVGGSVVAAEDLPLVGEAVVASTGVNVVAALFEPLNHLAKSVHMLGGRNEADRGVIVGIGKFVERVLKNRERINI
jgi:hypothetical protein